MAMQLSAIGAATASVGRALPGALRGLHALGKGLEFAGKLDAQLASVAASSNPLVQIAGMLQGGTPLATIVNHVAADLTNVLAHATGNAGNTTAQSTLQRALASALAPPGTSPPNRSGTQQAAILQQQLTNVVTRMMEEIQPAGQQSEFSGTVLDANSARETPAQQTKTPTGDAQLATAAVSSLVQSLLSRAAGAAPDPSAAQAAPGSAPGSSSQLQTPTAQALLAAQPAPPALPDILARMLARAANADAQRSGEASAHAAAPPQSTSSTSSTANPAAAFQRLIAAIAEQNAGSQSDTGGKQFSQDSQPAPAHAQNGNSTAPAIAGPAIATGTTAQTQDPGQIPTAAAAAVDPHAVIEQLVKGIMLRNTGSSSEVQLRLQPEHLGDVSLKLTVTGNTITASIVAQNSDVRDMLLSNQQHLARSLAESGLSLGRFSVDVSGGNAGFTGQQSAHKQQSAGSIAVGGSLLSGEDDSSEDQRFGPALMPGSKSLVFNYLA